MKHIVEELTKEIGCSEAYVNSAIELLFEKDCTIPFVARYRKEQTGSMDEVALRIIRDRYTYLTELAQAKKRYLKVVFDHCQSKPELKDKYSQFEAQFNACQTKQALEDLYLPFKPKRRTRAMMAKEKGLAPVLDHVMANLSAEIEPTVQEGLKTAALEMPYEEALKGLKDILAEQLAESPALRNLVREISQETGLLVACKNANIPDDPKTQKMLGKFENYFEYEEAIGKAQSHRVMAIRRGEAEKILKVQIQVNEDQIVSELKSTWSADKAVSDTGQEFFDDVFQDTYKRLLAPTIETEMRLELKGRAEDEAIKVFIKNLERLLFQPPVSGHVVMGVDPGLRTGSKLAIVSSTGKHVAHDIIYPVFKDLGAPKNVQAREKLEYLIRKHKVSYLAIGNGTGCREIDRFISKVLKELDVRVKKFIVNESGASVYSVDDIAREEFPDLDPTIRSAISIARRMQDPLAEFVKIDPRSIGVGQYQHDCNVVKLNRSLKDTIESCVNKVGVDLNTASFKLLSYVSGIGPNLAKAIVAHRDTHDRFVTREQLKEVKGFGDKTFEQAAGFLRIPEAENTLENSSVHPERYSLVETFATDLNVPVKELVGNKEIIATIPLEKYVSDSVGMPTLTDLVEELSRPGRDPRQKLKRVEFEDKLDALDKLKVGMKIKGKVSNVTNFGVFVDVGVHQDGLIHISELSDEFVKDPSAVLAVGDVVEVTVIALDLERRRISFSRRSKTLEERQKEAAAQRAQASSEPRASRPMDPRNSSRSGGNDQRRRPSGNSQHPNGNSQRPAPRGSQRSHHARNQKSSKQHTVGDLMSKFNVRS